MGEFSLSKRVYSTLNEFKNHHTKKLNKPIFQLKCATVATRLFVNNMCSSTCTGVLCWVCVSGQREQFSRCEMWFIIGLRSKILPWNTSSHGICYTTRNKREFFSENKRWKPIWFEFYKRFQTSLCRLTFMAINYFILE